MDIFSFVRLLVGNRQVVVLVVFAFLLENEAVSVPPTTIEVFGWTASIDQGRVLSLTLIAVAIYSLLFLLRTAWSWLHARRLQRALDAHLEHNRAFVFSFDTRGLSQSSHSVERPLTWNKVIAPSAPVDDQYDQNAKEAAALLDKFCFGTNKGNLFAFAGEGETTATLWFASIVRISHAKEDTAGLAGFGFIENRRSNGQSSRFAVAIDERVANPDIDGSWIAFFQKKATISVTLRQFVNISGPERYFSIHLLLPFKRKSFLSQWHLSPVLMYIDLPYQARDEITFRGSDKVLLGYGGRLDLSKN